MPPEILRDDQWHINRRRLPWAKVKIGRRKRRRNPLRRWQRNEPRREPKASSLRLTNLSSRQTREILYFPGALRYVSIARAYSTHHLPGACQVNLADRSSRLSPQV